MNRLRTASITICAVLIGFGEGTCCAERWQVFQSKTQHFSVRYPVSWNQLQGVGGTVDTSRLDIINFSNSQRAEGVVIKKSGAEITVSGPPEGIRTVAEWIRGDISDDPVLDERDVPVGSPEPHACTSIKQVSWKSEVGPNAYFVYTGYYCATDGRFYRILLTNWAGDRHQTELRKTAFSIALSLRSQ